MHQISQVCQVLDPAEEHTEQRSPEAKQRTLEKKKATLGYGQWISDIQIYLHLEYI